MEQLNAGNSLWKPFDAMTAGQTLDGSPQAKSSNPPDNFETPAPICCWNICVGVYVPIASPRARRKPAPE
jgi:hypothetical protein